MSTSPESIPTIWSVDDVHFFRAVADVFAADFLWGASALLASYDVEPADTPAAAAVGTHNPARTEPVATWPLAA